MDIILIVLLTCGFPDTFIIKEPDKKPVYYRSNNIDNVYLNRVILTEPTVIVYKDNREVCV